MSEEFSLLEEFQDQLGYTFSNLGYLNQALTTRSYSNEHLDEKHNESLATLGDAVAKIIITHHAITTLNMTTKGAITDYKNKFETRENFTVRFLAYFPEINSDESVILQLLRFGKGEKENRQYLENNFFGELLEALFGSIFLDTYSDLVRTSVVIKRILRIK
ncbi:MAG: Ribonuclease 3 [Candidatus Heimdallarchaeota archaeon LC_2]|nr:MAG: Ribonuclease 3 [Candidatus Heimdallarchaeota archaeon LC_2]